MPASQPRNLWMIALEVLREPMFMLLPACAIYVVLGICEALILFASVMVIVAITIYQAQDRRALEALRDDQPACAGNSRGVQLRIAGRGWCAAISWS